MAATTTSAPLAGPTRRELSDRQARTAQRLAEAAVEELRAVGYERLTVRTVARRAGVAPATAYNYFASKEHLVTDVFWRRLRSLPEPDVDRSRHSSTRVSDALADVVLLVADEPELATACTAAMLATDPDVKDLRERIGGAIHQRLARALGDGADPAALGALELAATGALVAAGMGHLAYPELPARLHEVAELVLDGRS